LELKVVHLKAIPNSSSAIAIQMLQAFLLEKVPIQER